jgi:hypothetical protein
MEHFTKSGQEPDCGHENALLSRWAVYILGQLHIATPQGNLSNGCRIGCGMACRIRFYTMK